MVNGRASNRVHEVGGHGDQYFLIERVVKKVFRRSNTSVCIADKVNISRVFIEQFQKLLACVRNLA